MCCFVYKKKGHLTWFPVFSYFQVSRISTDSLYWKKKLIRMHYLLLSPQLNENMMSCFSSRKDETNEKMLKITIQGKFPGVERRPELFFWNASWMVTCCCCLRPLEPDFGLSKYWSWVPLARFTTERRRSSSSSCLCSCRASSRSASSCWDFFDIHWRSMAISSLARLPSITSAELVLAKFWLMSPLEKASSTLWNWSNRFTPCDLTIWPGT